MVAFLLLIRTQYSEVPTLGAVKQFHETVWDELREVQGFKDSYIWTDTVSPEKQLTIHLYESSEAAEAGLKVSLKDRLLERSQAFFSDTADVLGIKILSAEGLPIKDLSACEYISLSIRFAEPGFAKEMQEDLQRVFDECSFLDGFTGYIIGANKTLDEELIGIASWNSEAAFKSSIPPGIMYQVYCYRKAW